MDGHLEQAAGVLNSAAEQVPVEMMAASLESLSTVAQYAQHVGGDIGQQLTQEAFAAQQQVESLQQALAQLRERCNTAATQILYGGA